MITIVFRRSQKLISIPTTTNSITLDYAVDYRYRDFKKIILNYNVKVFELERVRVGAKWIKALKVPQLVIDNKDIIEWLDDVYIGKGWKWKNTRDRNAFFRIKKNNSKQKKNKLSKVHINNRKIEGYQ